MPHTNWVTQSFQDIKRTEEEKKVLIDFWKNFYKNISNIISEHGKGKSVQYKEKVFSMLKLYRLNEKELSSKELHNIQYEIEDLTMKFDEKSIYKSFPSIIRKLIRNNEVNGKDYLRGRKLEKDDYELLSEFGQYTIEAIIVHVLGMVFNTVECNSIIRVASLVEQLESSVRMQALFFKYRKSKNTTDSVFKELKENKKRSKLDIMYPFGSGLVQFMEERGMISLFSDLNGTTPRVKKGAYYLPSNLYAFCNIEISLLPIKLNLPMVCKPLDWTSAIKLKTKNLSDLTGGYLSGPTGEIYDRYRLLSTGDIQNFNIELGENHENLCSVMNKLQSQCFQINSVFLKYLQDNSNILVEYGYLMPGFLSTINIKEVSILLRKSHMMDEGIKKLCSFSELLHTLCKNIQRARYEKLIIDLAIAYEGYNFYLPAFLDFRGRIYRCGILHFHERDLARSLIVFSDTNSDSDKDTMRAAAAFHYESFVSVEDSLEWFNNNLPSMLNQFHIYEVTLLAKRPFQFLANIFSFDSINMSIPITQDASSSAYQIMSYFLLDESLAKRTNLISDASGQIQDVYCIILEELKEFMKAELEINLSQIVSEHLTRKLVKGIFMPIIYGKTLMSTASNIKDHLSHYLTHKECFDVASVCFKFWRTKYQNMECLIRLIRHIGWIASARDRPVLYRVPYFSTVQDYMVMDAINIYVYDTLHKKRRRVTLRVSSSKRDRRKTEISTFVNFIHQRDAHIAMSVVEKMLSMNIPIYTVHDNFITTAQYSNLLPRIYRDTFIQMGPPLSIINEFIYMNIIQPLDECFSKDEPYSKEVISFQTLNSALRENVPEKISKKMMSTWEERISGILTSYENYTRNVCGGNPSWKAHEKKWNKFQLQLSNYNNNYSVHY